MIKRRLDQIAVMCGGQIPQTHADAEIEGVGTDSRRVAEGMLFVPIAGERFDGHDYVAGALSAGAAAAMWRQDRPVPEELREAPLLLVDDTLAALQRLASAYRNELRVKVVGITGSNGKTTTKDMVAAMLQTSYRVHKTAGNLNNHIGLPLTVLQLDEETDAAVLEMGMSGFGEIELLTGIARPDIAIITNIGDAHLLQLGSRRGIAKAKLEIALGLRPGGLLLYNGDEPLLKEELAGISLPEGTRLETFGMTERNDWSPANIELEAVSSSFTVRSAALWGDLGAVSIPVPGRHNVSNALAAIAAARHLGVAEDAVREGLGSGLSLTGMRIEPVSANNGAMILNDAYNANPTAVRAALDLVEQLSGYRRKWIVLGDMMELGPDEVRLHREVGEYVTPDKADAVLTFGELSKHIGEGARSKFAAESHRLIRHFEDRDELAAWLRNELSPDDLVLVKGSRAMRMETIVQALEAR